MNGVTFGVLMGAADYLEEHGWLRHYFGYDGGPACALGAIHVAMGGRMPGYPGRDADHETVNALGLPYRGVTHWNDAPGRTETEVVTRLRAAAYRVLRGDDAPFLNEYAPC